MSAKSKRKPVPPTPEQLKALVDQLSPEQQQSLVCLCMADPASWAGRCILALLSIEFEKRLHAEKRAGFAQGDIDPDNILRMSVKEAMRRLGMTEGAVKMARKRARERLANVGYPLSCSSSPL